MSPRVRRTATLAAMAVLAACVTGWAQNEEPVARAAPVRAACAFRTATLMPVADTKAIGYANNTRALIDSTGVVSIAVRSKHGSQFTIGLVRAAVAWKDGEEPAVTWIEDRDSLPFSGAPQRVAAIAAAPDGTIHMAWYGGVRGETDHEVHYAHFTTGKSTRIAEEQAPFRVPGFESVAAAASKPMELWQEHAAIAVGPDGTVHLAWEARDAYRRASDGLPRPGIAYATRSPNGAWSVNAVLDRPPYLQVDDKSGQSRPSILVDRTGLVHVLCYGAVGGVQQILYGTTAGRGFSGWKPVAPSSGDQRHAAGALDAQGRLHVAWREGVGQGGSAIMYSVRDAEGHWRSPARLSPAGENASTPSVGVTDSSVCIAWVAWDPGAKNSDGEVDNGFPADNSTVEGRVEITSSPLAREQFEPPTVTDRGPASYPCWAIGPSGPGAVRPPIVWTSVDAGGVVNLKLGWCERGK